MRSVNIALENRSVLPGETLSGRVIVITDNAFDCNRIVVKLKSRERTQYGSGKHRRVDKRTILSKVFRISEGRTIPEGKTEIPFSFKLPMDLPPSYNGWYGNIRHSIEAVVEVDWALDPKLKQEYRVLQQRPPYIPFTQDTEAHTKENEELNVTLDDNVLRLDKGILVKFQVGQRDRINAVRIEIKKVENAKCGWKNLSHETTAIEKRLELREYDWGMPKEQVIGENWNYYLPFFSTLFRVSFILKITLEVGWDFDPSVMFNLRFSDVPTEKLETDIFDEIAIDLGMEDW